MHISDKMKKHDSYGKFQEIKFSVILRKNNGKIRDAFGCFLKFPLNSGN